LAGIIGPGLRLAASAVAVWIAPTATAAAWAYLVAEALLFVVTALMLRQLLPPSDGSTFSTRRLYRFSAPMSLNRLLLYSNNQTETLFLGFLASSATLGVFGIARRLSQIVGSALLAAVAVLFDPLVAGLHHTSRTDDLDQLFKTSTRWLFTLGLPVSLLEIVFARDIMRIFGPDFAVGGAALAILTTGQLINVATGISANLQAMAGYTKVTLMNALGFVALSLVFDAAMIPAFGLIGAAIANSAAVVSINVIRLVQIKKRLGISPYDRKFLRPIAAAIPGAALALLLPVANLGSVIALLIRAAVLGVVYIGVLMMLGIDSVDREILRGAFGRLRSRGRSRTTAR
jgi:O-antigen/teichoic acid export membrane protein